MAIPEHLSRLRTLVGHDLLLTPSVTAFVRRDLEEVLVMRPRSHSSWTLPGGLLELGESPADAVIREALEETGMDIEPTGIIGVFGGPDGFRRIYGNGDQIECLDILFECRVVGGAPGIGDEEISSSAYVPLRELADWMYPIPAETIMAAAKQGQTLFSVAHQIRVL